VSKSKTNNTIGFLKRKSLRKGNFEFKELIKVSQSFEQESENVYFVKGENIEQFNFNADNSKINFIQVVGVDPDKIIREKQKHKYSELAQVKISNPAVKISATLKNDDSIMFEVELNTGHIEKRFATLKSQEVSEANEEHYTWMAKS
jgi:phosphoribosylanthranilate isomerase